MKINASSRAVCAVVLVGLLAVASAQMETAHQQHRWLQETPSVLGNVPSSVPPETKSPSPPPISTAPPPPSATPTPDPSSTSAPPPTTTQPAPTSSIPVTTVPPVSPAPTPTAPSPSPTTTSPPIPTTTAPSPTAPTPTTLVPTTTSPTTTTPSPTATTPSSTTTTPPPTTTTPPPTTTAPSPTTTTPAPTTATPSPTTQTPSPPPPPPTTTTTNPPTPPSSAPTTTTPTTLSPLPDSPPPPTSVTTTPSPVPSPSPQPPVVPSSPPSSPPPPSPPSPSTTTSSPLPSPTRSTTPTTTQPAATTTPTPTNKRTTTPTTPTPTTTASIVSSSTPNPSRAPVESLLPPPSPSPSPSPAPSSAATTPPKPTKAPIIAGEAGNDLTSNTGSASGASATSKDTDTSAKSGSSSSGSEDSTASSSSSSTPSPSPSASSSSSRSRSSSSSRSGSSSETGKRTPTATARTRQARSLFHDMAVYTGVTVAAVSVALLMGLHVFAFDAPWLNWPHESMRANGWELLLYVCYVQQIASLSQLEIGQIPPFLTQFTDALSWSNLQIQRNKIVGSTATVRRLLDGGSDQPTKGLDAYASRIDIASSDLLVNAVIAIAILAALLLLVFVALMLCGKRPAPEDKFDMESSPVLVAAREATAMPELRRGTLWVLGFGIVLWFAVLFPLTTFATFDLVMLSTNNNSSSANTSTSNAALAVSMLVLFAGVALCALGFAIHSKSDEQLMSSNRLKVYGALYADVTHGFRWFFAVTALAQITLGVCVGAIKDEATQLTVAIVIVGGYLAIVLLCSPFTSQTPLFFTVALCVIKIATLSIAFAFVSDTNVTLAGRVRAGNAILGLHLVVLLLWLLRLLVMFATLIRLYAERSVYAQTTTPYAPHHRESTKHDRDAPSLNPILGGSGVYVTMLSPDDHHEDHQGGRLGSEYGDSMDNGTAPRRTARLARL